MSTRTYSFAETEDQAVRHLCQYFTVVLPHQPYPGLSFEAIEASAFASDLTLLKIRYLEHQLPPHQSPVKYGSIVALAEEFQDGTEPDIDRIAYRVAEELQLRTTKPQPSGTESFLEYLWSAERRSHNPAGNAPCPSSPTLAEAWGWRKVNPALSALYLEDESKDTV